MPTALPVKSHHTGSPSTVAPTAWSDTFAVMSINYRQWFPTYTFHELPTAGTGGAWLPRNWVFKPESNQTVTIQLHFTPDPATWEEDTITGYFVNNTTNAKTTIVPATEITIDGGACTPSFVTASTSLALLANNEYFAMWEFADHMFNTVIKCKSWISLTQTAAAVTGNATTL